MFYDYTSEKVVQDVVTDDLAAIVDDVLEEFNSLHRYDIIYIYCPVNIGRVILSEMTRSESRLLLENGYPCEYDEVVITVNCAGGIYVENARTDDGILKFPDGVINYVYDSFLAKEADQLAMHCASILVFGTRDTVGVRNIRDIYALDRINNINRDDIRIQRIIDDSDGKLHGFYIIQMDDVIYGTVTYSYYSSEPVTNGDILTVLKQWDFV